MYGSVFAIEDFAASVGFSFGTCSKKKVYIEYFTSPKNCFEFHYYMLQGVIYNVRGKSGKTSKA